jgi:hypothetical protein
LPIIVRLLAILTALSACLLAAPVALPAPPVGAGAISDQLASADVAIDPAARVTPEERRRLVRVAATLRADGIPVDFAVVRAEGLGAGAFAEALQSRLGYRGLQVVVVQEPPSIGFASENIFSSERDARRVLDELTPRLGTDYVGAAGELARRIWTLGLAAEARRAQRGTGDDGGSGLAGGLTAAGIAAAIAVVIVLRRRRSRRAPSGVVPPREALEPLVDSLAARITDLQPRADDPDVPEEVRSAYAEAVIAYAEASEQLPRTKTAADATRVQRVLERGMSAARRAEALLEGSPSTHGGQSSPRRRRRRRQGPDPG